MQATGQTAWAALSTSGLRTLELPASVRDVVVLADGDDAEGLIRCDPDTHEPRGYSTFCAKSIGMNGKNLPPAIRDVFIKLNTDRVTTKTLIAELILDPEGPWLSYGKGGKPVTDRQLAGLLSDFNRGYGIKSKDCTASAPPHWRRCSCGPRSGLERPLPRPGKRSPAGDSCPCRAFGFGDQSRLRPACRNPGARKLRPGAKGAPRGSVARMRPHVDNCPPSMQAGFEPFQ
jgi:hypothetical protein